MIKRILLGMVALLGLASNANAQWIVDYGVPQVPFYSAPYYPSNPTPHIVQTIPASNMNWSSTRQDEVRYLPNGSVEIIQHSKAVTYSKGSKEYELCQQRRDSSCRVNGGGKGSGTLIAKKKHSNGRTVGVILTCAHVFDPMPWDKLKDARVTVQFRMDNDEVRLCQPLAVDWNNDLLVMAAYIHPDTPVTPVAVDYPDGGKGIDCYVCGYGPSGKYQCHIGPVVGYTSVSWEGGQRKTVPADRNMRFVSSGKNQIYVSSAGLRKGDSGGGMIDKDGRLVGVFWGGGGQNTYGTYCGTINKFLGNELPQAYQWACDPRYRRPVLVPVPQPQQPQQPTPQTPPPRVEPQHPEPQQPEPQQPEPQQPEPQQPTQPTQPTQPQQPAGPTHEQLHEDHKQILAHLESLLERTANLEMNQQGLLEGQNTLAQALMQTPTKEDLAKIEAKVDGVNTTVQQNLTNLVTRIEGIEQGQVQLNGAMAQLQAKVNEAAGKDATVTLKVESGRYISPSYVDVSVLWALQQQTGIDHMVLITDTSADHWTTRMKGEYEAAKQKFPAIILYDVKSTGVRFKELPQLVVYPSKPGGEPVIVKGTDGVSKELQKITRDELPGS